MLPAFTKIFRTARTIVRRHGRAIVATLVGAAVVVVLGGLLFAWSGLYSVAASRGHWFFVEWFLTFAMRNSVETHALRVDPPQLDDPDLVRLGAAHFYGTCAYCHGSPDRPINPVAREMLPPPPDLSHAATSWKERELFWLVKHGLKYTGMPAWPSRQRDDEVWAVVAFLLALPRLDGAAYRELALGTAILPQPSGRELALSGDLAEAVAACARCHGAGDGGPVSRYVPLLHGQRAEYLLASMQAYAAGRRASGIMQPIASDLSPDTTRRVVEYYAKLSPPAAQQQPAADAGAIARGATLAAEGAPDRQVPPCLPCHGGTALPAYPLLAGRSAAYLAGQLRLWQGGLARGTPGDSIMAPIARRMSAEQVEDAAAYFESVDR